MSDITIESPAEPELSISFQPEFTPPPEFLAAQEAPEDGADRGDRHDAADTGLDAEIMSELEQRIGADPMPCVERAQAIAADIGLPTDVVDAVVAADDAVLTDFVLWLSEAETMRGSVPPARALSRNDVHEVDREWPDSARLLRSAWGSDYEHRLALASAAFEARAPSEKVILAIAEAGPEAWAEAIAMMAEVGERLTGARR